MRLIRLAGLVSVAVMAMSFAAVSSASAFSSNPLFTPASGQTVTGEGSASTLKAAGLVVSCTTNHVVAGNVSNSLLVGGIVIHYLGCTFVTGEGGKNGCTAKSVGGGEGLIQTNTLHGILGLLLPGNTTGILFLPVSGSVFTTFAATGCSVETKVTGTVAAEVSPVGKGAQTTGKIVTQAKPGIDLTHGLGFVTAKLVAFGETGELQQTDNITFSVATEVT